MGGRITEKHRATHRARQRALQDLKEAFPKAYLKLYKERLASIKLDDAMNLKAGTRRTAHRRDPNDKRFCVACDKSWPCATYNSTMARRDYEKWRISDGPKCPQCNIKIPRTPADIKQKRHYHCPTCDYCLHKKYPYISCSDYVPPTERRRKSEYKN